MPVKIAKVDQRFLSPGPQPNGLQAADDGLWYIDQRNNRVYKLDWETGKTLFEAQTTTDRSSGITLGGGFLWIASTYNCKIAKLDPETAETIEEFPTPGAGGVAWRAGTADTRQTGAHGLEWRDDRLWIAVPPSQMIYCVNPHSWKIEHSVRSPGLRVHGIAWGPDGALWSADTAAGTISLLDTYDGRVQDVFRVEAPTEVHGMTIRDGVLWYCDAETRGVGRLLV